MSTSETIDNTCVVCVCMLCVLCGIENMYEVTSRAQKH